MKPEKIDIRTWERREIFEFFKDFEEPYFGITQELDCTEAYDYAKKRGISFFLFYLYLTLKAVNQNEAFKYRIERDELLFYDVIHGSATIDREDGTFGFSHILYFEELETFFEKATEEVRMVRASNHLMRSGIGENIIHFSALPWISFTHVSHARSYKRRDSIPKITYGKFHYKNGRKMIPVSVHMNHAVADGIHVGLFLENLQKLFSGS